VSEEVFALENQVKAYWSKDIAMQLEISTSTLRKWSLALEREGYTFIRDENERRAYIFSDLDVFKQVQKLIHNGNSVEDASKAVAVRHLSDSKERRTLAVRPENQDEERSSLAYIELMKEQQELKKNMESFMESISKQHHLLHQELANQRDYIEESLKRRDEQLLMALHEMAEQRKQAAVAKKWWTFGR